VIVDHAAGAYHRRRVRAAARVDALPKVPCPHCSGSSSIVVRTTPVLSREGIRRRRECDDCHQRFTTIELLDTRPAPARVPGEAKAVA
jgi:hypothetical protein